MMIFSMAAVLAGLLQPTYVTQTIPQSNLYINSEGSPLLPLLESARNSIDIEIYTMKDPTVRSLLRKALGRNVNIRMVKEPHPVGEKCRIFEAETDGDSEICTDEKHLISEIREAGGEVVPFNKQNLCPNEGGGPGGGKCFEHGKLALVDGVALLSTGNFDSTSLCAEESKTCNRDYTVVLTDSTLVDTLKDLFEADLTGESYDVRSKIPASLKNTLTVSPDPTSLFDFLNSAEESISLEAQYLKDPSFNAILESQAKKGVKVSVTVASACAFAKPKGKAASDFRSTYSKFDRLGISTTIFDAQNKINGKRGYLHAKAIVVDGKRGWIGSENGSTTSLTENREYGVIFENTGWVETLRRTMDSDHESEDSETWEESLNCVKDR
jgi:phosphatidylserine/phosphatidylglycerophosphate/cardiolipin synthase-like enzyme